MLYYSLDNFKTNFIIDFTDLETVYRVYALSPKIIFALTWGEKKENNTEYPFYKLMKTTNYGNSWSTLFETSKGDSVYNFRVFDEENIALTGKFHPAPHIRSSFLQTKNGGKNWIYLFEPNYSDYYNNSIA
jgi:hypothetical protein